MENNKETNLVIGDKVIIKRDTAFHGFIYKMCNVVRLTKTQAILDNGDKLINKTIPFYNQDGKTYFEEYGNRHVKWFKATEDDEKDYAEHKRREKIIHWYNSKMRDFSFEEIEKIHNLLNVK